jgi:uncharacterized protein YecE (DUF72 family)
VRILVVTNANACKERKASFQPKDLPAGDVLRFYAGRLPTVEASNWYYRIP